MTTTVTVDVVMGFTALSGGTYLGLSVSDQKNFKSHFIANMEDSTEGIPASERSGWLGFSHTADDDGHIAESSIESDLAAKLASVGTGGADAGPGCRAGWLATARTGCSYGRHDGSSIPAT